jgi:hypothetical protein
VCVKGKAGDVVVIYGGTSDEGVFARYSGFAEKAWRTCGLGFGSDRGIRCRYLRKKDRLDKKNLI